MKKIILLAAACAVLFACTKVDKENPLIGEGTAFMKGQKVTLTVSAGTGTQSTKVSSELNADGETVDLKWKGGDKILVKVGESATAEFTLSGGAGTTEASFSGVMPAAGSTFSIQYPVTVPDINNQTYSSDGNSILHDEMLFTATNCTLGQSCTLAAQNAVLRLNLYGEKSIGKIVVTNTSSESTPKPAYTLSCGSGVEPGKGSEPKPFFIIVPEGSYIFKVESFDTESTPAVILSHELSAATEQNRLKNGSVLNMPPLGYPGTDAQPVAITTGTAPSTTTVVWAPVNCGYDATDYLYGKLFQWGRHDGCGYNASWTNLQSQEVSAEGLIQNSCTEENTQVDGSRVFEDKTIFYWGDNLHDWLSTIDQYRWNSATGDNDPSILSPYRQVTPTKTKNDPCPDGWRTPTNYELSVLLSVLQSTPSYDKGDGKIRGYYFGVAPNQIFLPLAGGRSIALGNVSGRNGFCVYWSSSVGEEQAMGLVLGSSDQWIEFCDRAFGYPVRCVQE